MKNFELTSAMLTMSGVFYPNGYIFIMFPNAGDAENVAREVDADRVNGGETMLLSPATILRDIGKVDGDSDVVLPSVGTESATVHKYVELARQGHHAMMAKVKSDEHAASITAAAKKFPLSYGQRYHLLAMEDIEVDAL